MDFDTIFRKINPALKRLARHYNGYGTFSDEYDLFQEISIYLWENYRDGVPLGINEAYIIKGCRFHILNFLRKERERIKLLSLEEPINEDGLTLKDTLQGTDEPLDRRLDGKMIFEEIINNGFSNREKQIFSYLRRGFTVREIGERLGISHVMVLKCKRKVIEKCQKK